jgi:Zn-dependent membrane protease YugP
MFMDPLFMMLALPGLLLGMLAAFLTKSTFAKYAQVGVQSGLTGAEAARQMLHAQDVHDVEIHPTQGFLSDHYDPRTHSLHLSPDVYHGQSLSAIGVACHEAGHALQQAQGYALMGLRSALLPVTIAGQNIAPILFMVGLGIGATGLVKIGIALFAVAVLFAIITLPIEWDASARAKRYMGSAGIVTAAEYPYAAKVLNAAFLTYVAGAITAVLQLLYFLIRAGLIGGRRND